MKKYYWYAAYILAIVSLWVVNRIYYNQTLLALEEKQSCERVCEAKLTRDGIIFDQHQKIFLEWKKHCK